MAGVFVIQTIALRMYWTVGRSNGSRSGVNNERQETRGPRD